MAIIVRDSLAVDFCGEEEGLDVGDLILFGMGETIQGLKVISGVGDIVVKLGGGVEVTMGEQDVRQPWRARLGAILGLVRDVVEANPCLDRDEACKALLKGDGWSWTRATFRTPLWMFDYDEILLPVVVQEFEVLKWLAVSV